MTVGVIGALRVNRHLYPILSDLIFFSQNRLCEKTGTSIELESRSGSMFCRVRSVSLLEDDTSRLIVGQFSAFVMGNGASLDL